jgi:hypothetical protein
MAKPDLLKQIENALSSFSKKFEENFSADKILSQLIEVDKRAAEMTKSFGVGRDNIESINAGLTQAVTNVTLLGGSFQDVADIQMSVSKDLGRNVILTSETVEKLYATFKVTNVSVENLSKNFKDIGFSSGQISGQMELVVKSARAIGVNAQEVSKQAVSNLSLMNQYNFQGGVEGLAKMAAQAVNLRINVTDIKGAMEKAFNPESAIEMAAAMQRLGVAQGDLLDPLRLMDLSQNDPTELQNQIAQMSKQFVQLNEKGQFEIMPGAKRQMMEIEKEMGLASGTLSKMAISGAELDTKLQKIKFPDFMTEEQQKFIANMAEMDSKGEYKIQVGTESLGLDEAMKRFEETPDLLNKFMKDQGKPEMQKLAEEQLSATQSMQASLNSIATTGYGLAGSKTGKDLLQSSREAVKTTAGFTRNANPLGGTTKQQSESIDLVYKGINDLADTLVGDKSVTETFKSLGEIGVTLTNQLEKNLSSAIDGASSSLTKLSESGNQFYDIINKIVKKVTGDEIPKKVTTGGIEPTKIEAKDFMINTLPEDKIVMAGGTNIDNSKNMGSKNSSTPEEIKITITHDIKGTPPNIDVAQLAQMMTNSDITQTIVREIKRTTTNNGLNEPYRPTESFGYVG